ncbi:MAG: hypothetical protein AAF629_37070 [Chloroflexota bacterium]
MVKTQDTPDLIDGYIIALGTNNRDQFYALSAEHGDRLCAFYDQVTSRQVDCLEQVGQSEEDFVLRTCFSRSNR